MKERKRKHDDVHWPLQGRGKRATAPKRTQPTGPRCSECGLFPAGATHLCPGPHPSGADRLAADGFATSETPGHDEIASRDQEAADREEDLLDLFRRADLSLAALHRESAISTRTLRKALYGDPTVRESTLLLLREVLTKIVDRKTA